MKKEVIDYEVRPGVVPAGEMATVRIIPRGSHVRFDDRIHRLPYAEKKCLRRSQREFFERDAEAEYRIYFLPMEHNVAPESEASLYESVTVRPLEDGSLEFRHCFQEEQEYKLIVMDAMEDGREPDYSDFMCSPRLSIYVLHADLYGMRAYRGDFHAHSYYSDGREDSRIVAANYRKRGFDFMALTDHHRMYPSQMLAEFYRDVPTDLAIFIGEEVHVPFPSYIHAVNFGGSYSVNEYYEDHMEECDGEVARIEEGIQAPEGVSARDLARRIWVAEQIRRSGGMPILVHPHWISNAYNMPDAVTDYLFAHRIYDAFELLGGIGIHENNVQTAFYQDQRARGREMPIVGSSDSHGTEPESHFTWTSSIVLAKGNSLEDLTEAVKNLCSVAVESYPGEAHRVYGRYRLVKYARYLLENYFPRHDELCFEQGRLMKDFVCDEEGALETLKAIQGRTDRFAERFFGWRHDGDSPER